jgi:uncharacterized protein YgbK (DUF1537 family)
MSIQSSRLQLTCGGLVLQGDREKILLAFYGDDFTGTAATAEALAETGTPTVMFTKPPTVSFLTDHFPQVRAVGVAGMARTLAADELEGALTPVFETMKGYHAPIFLYKVCSTFDSSENIGSIGRAIEIGKKIFSPDFVPILSAAPKLGRFTVFGHHFAALGQGEIYRLDRHPSMARHPVTPMEESDLRLHLAKQTELKSGLINLFTLDKGKEQVQALLDKLIAESIPIVFFDCLYDQHLMLACEVIWQRARSEKPVFFVGSQELGYGLGGAWQNAGLLPVSQVDSDGKSAPHKGSLFVLSGSCATVTGEQILWAIENGFVDIGIQPWKLLDPADKPLEQARVTGASLSALQQGHSIVVHTAIGPNDSRIGLTKEKAKELSLAYETANEILGDALGEIALKILQVSNPRRFVVAGGDTAGRIQKHLSIQALQVAKPIGIAAPLCYVYSSEPTVNGLEMAFKGGQVGSINYFGKAQAARTPAFETAAWGRF